MESKKTRFELRNKFCSYFSSQFPVFFTEKESVFCGRQSEGSVEVTVLNGISFEKVSTLNDEDKITSYTVGHDGSTIFIALKNLFLKSFEVPSMKTIKAWQSFHQRPILKMAVNHNCSRLVTAAGDAVIRLWHLGPKEGYSASCRSHNSIASLLCFHPTEPFFFSSAVGDYTVVVWNAETGAKLSSLEGHQSTVTCICFNSEGTTLATCGRDKVVIVWSCPEFARITVFPTFESLEACIFLPVGALVNHLGDSVASEELLMSGGQWGCLRVWNLKNGRCVLEIKGPLDRCALSSEASGTQNRQSIDYGLHSVVSLELVRVVSNPTTTSKLILVRQSNHIEVYHPMCAKLLSECLGDVGQVDQLCIIGRSHNHLLLADASPHLKVFPCPYGLVDESGNVGSWSCHLVPGGHSDVITDLAVSTCGLWVASGSKDQSICLWNVVDREPSYRGPTVQMLLIHHLKSAHSAHISALCFDKLTTLLISTSEDNVLKSWTVQLPGLENKDSPMAKSVLSITEWSVIHGAHQASVNAIDVSVNNQLVATASRDKTVKIWTVATSGLECMGVLQGHRRGVWSVCFSRHEKVVLSASGDGDIKLWNLKDFSCIRTFEGHEQPVYKAVFISHDRQILSCDQVGLVRLWDVGRPVTNVVLPEPDSSNELSTCRVYEAHEGRIWAIVVSPNESGFYTGGEDETLCYFQDVTEKTQMERSRKQEEFVQTQQLLDNLIHDKQLAAALRLAVKLDQPKRTLDLLQDLLLSDVKDCAVKKPVPGYRQVARLRSALDGLLFCSTTEADDSSVLLQRLLTYLVNWNTRARTSTVAQCVLNWLLTTRTPEQLLEWPVIARTIESLIPYTVRHYQRISRLEERLAVLDYLCDLADEHQVMGLAESPSMASDVCDANDIVELNLSMEVDG